MKMAQWFLLPYFNDNAPFKLAEQKICSLSITVSEEWLYRNRKKYSVYGPHHFRTFHILAFLDFLISTTIIGFLHFSTKQTNIFYKYSYMYFHNIFVMIFVLQTHFHLAFPHHPLHVRVNFHASNQSYFNLSMSAS